MKTVPSNTRCTQGASVHGNDPTPMIPIVPATPKMNETLFNRNQEGGTTAETYAQRRRSTMNTVIEYRPMPNAPIMLAGGFAMLESMKMLKLSTHESSSRQDNMYVMMKVITSPTTNIGTRTFGVNIFSTLLANC